MNLIRIFYPRITTVTLRILTPTNMFMYDNVSYVYTRVDYAGIVLCIEFKITNVISIVRG